MAYLKLITLGAPVIELDGEAVELSRRKAAALLIYLAVTQQHHTREKLAGLFWGDSEQSKAFAYLRTTLWTLNKALGEAYLNVEEDRVGVGGSVWVDALQFSELAASDDLTHLAAAAELYQGDFLSGFALPDCPEFDDWLFFQRESLRQELSKLLEQLTHQLMEQQQFEAAIPYARRLVLLDSLHEPAQRLLMQVYHAAGQRAAALRQYQEFADLLERELGDEPDSDTQALYRAIQENRARRGAVREIMITHLPAQTTPLIAREQEIEEMTALLNEPACRLLAVIGPGGIGKTSLALQLIREMAAQYSDGVYFVPLAPLTAAEYIIPAVADALRFKSYQQGDVYKQLRGYLNEKHMLLMLDNFEHVLDGAALVAELLASAPRLKILVTSRERLNLQEEWIYELHGLSYPASASNGSIEDYGAVQLFLQAARRVRSDFTLAEGDKPYVARICRLVEGMPLGIELAAAWLQLLTCREIAQEIERSLDFLSSSLRNLPSRHRSLRAVFDSSWERLSPLEKSTLSKISVFQGGFDRDAAFAVSQASLPVLLSLVNKSLLSRDEIGRYQIHELLRQFAAEKLGEDVMWDARRRHCSYYADYIHQREGGMKGQAQARSLNEIESEIDNLRAAWMWAAHRREMANLRTLMNGFTLFYLMRGRYQESKEMFGGTLDYFRQQPDLPPELRLLAAQIQILLAWIYLNISQVEKARALYREAFAVLTADETPDNAVYLVLLAQILTWPEHDAAAAAWAQKGLVLFQQSHDEWGIALALRTLGDVEHTGIRYHQSQAYYQKSYDLCHAIGDWWGEGNGLRARGEVAYTLGDYAEAERLYREALHLSEMVGEYTAIPFTLNRLGNLLLLQGRAGAADEVLQAAITAARRLGDNTSLGWAHCALADIAIWEERYDDAVQLMNQALDCFRVTESLHDSAWVYQDLSWVALRRGEITQAREWAQKGLAIFETLGSRWGQSAAFYRFGEAALLENDPALARQHLTRSLWLAVQACSIMLLLRHLVGWGKLLLKEGHPMQAAEVLSFIEQHPAAWYETRTRARQLLTEITDQPPAVETDLDLGAILRRFQVAG